MTWFPATAWRYEARAAAADQMATIAQRRIPPPLPEPRVRVRATAATWLHGGETVVVGETYTVAASTAATLCYREKAVLT